MGYDAQIVADSIANDVRLTTMVVTFPRIVLAEWNTHRMFSRNSASSRAIPVERRIAQIEAEPFVPSAFALNKAGMQAGGLLETADAANAERVWIMARNDAVQHAKAMVNLGVHKQWANRLIETFAWHTVVVSFTEIQNYWNLRDNPKAQPEIMTVTELMRAAYAKSTPRELKPGEWHLPFVTQHEIMSLPIEVCVQLSVARAAAVSYERHMLQDFDKDVARYASLLASGHMCFDESTDVLTKRGWKRWADVDETDELFAVDAAARTGSFEKPKALHRYEVDEDLYRVYGQQLDLKVTMNHNMVTSRRSNDGSWSAFDLERADTLIGKPRRYLKSVFHQSDGRAPLDLPMDLSPTVFMRFLGFFIGDGYAVDGNRAEFHLRKRRKIDYLTSLGVPVNELSNGKFVVSVPGLGTWLREHCYTSAGEKRFPEWILTLFEDEALALFDGLKNSDGSVRRKTWVYTTTSQRVADTLQALLHIHGKVGSFSYTPYGDGGMAVRVNVSDRVTPRVETGQNGRSLSYKEKVVRYRGTVYCATVSTGALLVRRNGHVVVSGNSPFEHPAKVATVANLLSPEISRFVPSGFLGNFALPWIQHRKTIPGEAVFVDPDLLQEAA